MYLKIVEDLKDQAQKIESDHNRENIDEFLKQFEEAVVANQWNTVFRLMTLYQKKGLENIQMQEVGIEELIDNCVNTDASKFQSVATAMISCYYILSGETSKECYVNPNSTEQNLK